MVHIPGRQVLLLLRPLGAKINTIRGYEGRDVAGFEMKVLKIEIHAVYSKIKDILITIRRSRY
jgi:hypothetical protein